MQTLGEWFEHLRSTEGGLTPSRMIAEAADEAHPFHDKFTWDDAVAGHQYRLIEARKLIRVRVTIEDVESQVRYVHVPSPDGGEGIYERLDVVVLHPDMRDRAMRAARADLESAQARVEELTTFGWDQKQVKKVARSIQRARTALDDMTQPFA